CPLTPAQARAYVADQAASCGLDAASHDLAATAKAVAAIARISHDLRERLTSFEANPLLVGERGAVAVDALAEVRPE
ncbi:MAG TPA: CoA-binding protein, partial [Actinomycetota bacterium]